MAAVAAAAFPGGIMVEIGRCVPQKSARACVELLFRAYVTYMRSVQGTYNIVYSVLEYAVRVAV